MNLHVLRYHGRRTCSAEVVFATRSFAKQLVQHFPHPQHPVLVAVEFVTQRLQSRISSARKTNFFVPHHSRDIKAASESSLWFDFYVNLSTPTGKRFEVPHILHSVTRTSAHGLDCLVLLFSVVVMAVSPSTRSTSHFLQVERLTSLCRRMTDFRLTPFI